jgi:hypothetical protein
MIQSNPKFRLWTKITIGLTIILILILILFPGIKRTVGFILTLIGASQALYAGVWFIYELFEFVYDRIRGYDKIGGFWLHKFPTFTIISYVIFFILGFFIMTIGAMLAR